MNRKTNAATKQVAGSLIAMMAIGLLTAGCSGGGSSGGGGAPPTGTATPSITAQPSDQIQSSVNPGAPRKVMLSFSANSPTGAALQAAINQLQSNPVQGLTINVTETTSTNADGSVTYNFVAEFDKPTQGGTYTFTATISMAGGGSVTTNPIDVSLGSNPNVVVNLNGSAGATSVNIQAGQNVTFDFNGTTDDQSLVAGTLDPGDGGGTFNLNLANPVQVVTYNNNGTFNASVSYLDSEGDETTVPLTVTVSNPPPVNQLELNGIAEWGKQTPGNQTAASVFTHVSNEPIILRGINFTKYAPTQLKVVINGTNYQPIVNSGIQMTVLVPMESNPVSRTVTLFAHAVGDVSTVLENAIIGNPAPTLNYVDNTTTRISFSGEDTVTGGGGNDGSIIGYDISNAGAVSNIRQIQGGNGHVWKGNAASVNDGINTYWLGNSGFTVKLFKTDLSGGVAPITTDLLTYPNTNQSPSSMTTTQDGRPVVLTQEVAGNYRLWVIKHDLSAGDTLVHFNVAGQTLPAGTPIVGLHTIVTDGIEYAIVVAGGVVRNVYKVRLDNNSYTVTDINDATNGFQPQASSLYRDITFGGYRLDMAGNAITGTGTDFRAMTFRTAQGSVLSARVNVGGSTNNVLGVQGYVDGGAHRVVVIRASESNYVIRNPDAGYAVVSTPSVGAGRVHREMLRAPGLNGFVIGYTGAGGAGAVLVPFDGSAVTALDSPVVDYQSLSIGRQAFSLEGRTGGHRALWYHRPSGKMTGLAPNEPPVNFSGASQRTGGGAAKFGVATP